MDNHKPRRLVRLFNTMFEMGIDIDLSAFPNNAALFVHYASSKDWDNRRLPLRAFEVAKMLAQADERLRAILDPKFEETFVKRSECIWKLQHLSKLDFSLVLDDEHVMKVTLMRKLSQLLAASGLITPEFVKEALEMADDENRCMVTMKFLAMIMPPEQFERHFSPFLPKEAKINLRHSEGADPRNERPTRHRHCVEDSREIYAR